MDVQPKKNHSMDDHNNDRSDHAMTHESKIENSFFVKNNVFSIKCVKCQSERWLRAESLMREVTVQCPMRSSLVALSKKDIP